VLVLALVGAGIPPARASALSTTFTYQGQLQQSGMPENATCDFQFTVFDQAGSGSPPTGGAPQGCVVQNGVVVTNGLFTVPLDFGSSPTSSPFTGSDRWLQVAVCCGGGCASATCPTVDGSYATLSPRQQLTATPYALYAPVAGSANGLSSSCSGCVSGSNIAAGAVTGSNLASSTVTGTNIAMGTITGSHLASGVAASNLGFTPAHAGANSDITALSGLTGNISLPESTATAGNILKGSTRFIHDYPGAGSGNTFVGESAGNFSLSGSNNTAVGHAALQSLQTGSQDTALGSSAGVNLTTGSNNIDIGYNVGGVAGESNTIRIGSGTTATFIAGITGVGITGGVPVVVNAAGQLGAATGAAATAGPRFVDNGDGTVTDTKTGLMWEKKTTDGSVHDMNKTYTWSTGTNDPDGTVFTVFLAKLNDTLGGGAHCFAGYCDWRLPSEDGQNPPGTGPEELETIVDQTQGVCGGGTGACVYPALAPTALNGYWSATTVAGNPGFDVSVYFETGNASYEGKTSHGYVRAVRSGL